MAYKFQLGAAVLSGSIKAEDGLVSTDVDDTTAANIVAQIDNKEIPHTKVALEDGDFLIGDGDGIAQNRTISGDATVSNTGVLTIANDAVEQAMIADDAVGADQLASNAVVNASIASNAAIDMDKLDGGSLAASLSDLAQGDLLYAGDVDDSNNIKSITFSNLEDAIFGNISGDATIAAGGALTIAATSVENGMLAGSIANSKLANSEVTIGSTAVALGGTQTSISGLTGLDFTAANASIASSLGANNLTLGGNASTVIVAGNLTVQGTTTTVDSTTINVSSSFTFEGPADDHELTLGLVDPTADRTVLLPNNSGVVAIFDPSLSDGELATTLTVAPSELNLLDGGTARGTSAFADGDGIIHNDGGTMKMTNVTKIAEYVLPKITGGDVHVDNAGAATIQADAVEASMLNNNCISGFDDIGADIASTDELLISDAGTLKRTDMSRLKTFIGSGVAAINAIGDANATLEVGINAPSAAASAPRTWTLPASAGLTVGEVIIIKAYGNSGTHPITIAQAGSQEIDGSTENIVLESDNAAISLYYVAADTFIIV